MNSIDEELLRRIIFVMMISRTRSNKKVLNYRNIFGPIYDP